jgi:hypothetical protein
MKTIFLLSLLLLAGCGGGTTVHAGPALPTKGADFQTCSADACSGHETTDWGYCHWEVHQGVKTFSAQLEIGVSTNQADGSKARCNLKLPHGSSTVINLRGTVNYTPFTPNLSSMALWVYADAGETMYAAKMTAKGSPATVPIEGTAGQPLVYASPLLTTGAFTVYFNDDLPEAKPTTISLGFSGDQQ